MRCKIFLTLITIFISNFANAQIITTYTINSSTIEKLEKIIDEETIIFIELDDVLVMPKSKMFHYNDNPYRLFIQNLITLSNQDSKYLNPVAQWYAQRKVRLVEDGWQNFIQDMQKRNAKVYGFCTMPIHLDKIEPYRLQEIKNLGINFTQKINIEDVVELNNIEGWRSVFYYGIIFTGPYNKAQTLLDLIKFTHIKPKKIIVFDKVKNELIRIEYSPLKAMGIGLYNILYLGARQFTDPPDEAIVKLQQQTLLEDGKWLEDHQAEELLHFKKENHLQGGP